MGGGGSLQHQQVGWKRVQGRLETLRSSLDKQAAAETPLESLAQPQRQRLRPEQAGA